MRKVLIVLLFFCIALSAFSTTRFLGLELNYEIDRYAKRDITEFCLSPALKYLRVGQSDRNYGFFSSHYISVPVIHKVKGSSFPSGFKSSKDFLGFFVGIVGFGTKIPFNATPLTLVLGVGGAYYNHTHYYYTDSKADWHDSEDTTVDFDLGLGAEANLVYRLSLHAGLNAGLSLLYKFTNSDKSSRFLLTPSVAFSWVFE